MNRITNREVSRNTKQSADPVRAISTLAVSRLDLDEACQETLQSMPEELGRDLMSRYENDQGFNKALQSAVLYLSVRISMARMVNASSEDFESMVVSRDNETRNSIIKDGDTQTIIQYLIKEAMDDEVLHKNAAQLPITVSKNVFLQRLHQISILLNPPNNHVSSPHAI